MMHSWTWLLAASLAKLKYGEVTAADEAAQAAGVHVRQLHDEVLQLRESAPAGRSASGRFELVGRRELTDSRRKREDIDAHVVSEKRINYKRFIENNRVINSQKIRFLTCFGWNRFSLTPCFAYGAESTFSLLPRNVHPIPVVASLPNASLRTPSVRRLPPERLPPERRLPLTPSDSSIARITREEAEGLELDGHGEEAREPVHRDTPGGEAPRGATGLDSGSGASVKRKRKARRRELRGSTAGAKLRW
jgi:hypothetical protein